MSKLRRITGSPVNPSLRSSRTASPVSNSSRSAIASTLRWVERPKTVQTRSTRQLAASAPKAEQSPGCGGTRTVEMPSSRAQALAAVGPAPPKGIRAKLSGIEPAIDRDQLDLVRHVLVRRLDDRVGRGFDGIALRRAQRAPQLGKHRKRRRRIEGDATAEEVAGVEATECQVGVGDGRVGTAAAVAH